VWGVVGISNLHYIGHKSVKSKGSIPLQVFFHGVFIMRNHVRQNYTT